VGSTPSIGVFVPTGSVWPKISGRRGRPLLPKILGQTDPVGAKMPIFNRYSLVAPQP